MIVFCWYICILVYLQWSIKRWAGILPGALSDLTGESAFLPLVSTGWKSFNHLSPDIYSDQLSNSGFFIVISICWEFHFGNHMSKQFSYNVKRGFLCRIFENSFQKVWITLNDLWINQKKNIILGVTLALDSKLVFLCVFYLQKCDRVIQHNQKDHHSDLVPQRKSLYHMT